MIARSSTPHAQHVLVVEDNPGDARFVRELLHIGLDTGTVVECVDTIDAAGRYLAINPVTCVLLDLSLPDAQGLEGLEALHAAAPQVPIVVLSGLDDEEVAVRAVQAGAQDYLMKGRVDEGLVSRAVRYAVERKRSELELVRLALHDAVTGLPNRALFLDRLQVALARSRRSEREVAVLIVDIDRFKLINDSLGHQAGDRLLSLVAARLSEQAEPGDTVARFGGDEFAILTSGVRGPSDAVGVAEAAAHAISAPFTLDDTEVFLTASVGIAVSDVGHQSAPALVRDADAAMHRAKERGRARHEIFDQVMRTAPSSDPSCVCTSSPRCP